MRLLARNFIFAVGTVAAVGTLAVTGVTAPASAATTAVPSATASPSATATASPSATVSAAATPSAAASPSTSPSATPSSSATPSTVQADPSLAVQNAAGDHAMGSTVAANEGTGGTTARSFSAEASPMLASSGIQGLDVSAWQTGINWQSVWNNGARFAYVKATEGTTYQSSQFASQYSGSYNVGMIRGAYHFATPNTSSGSVQASYFVAHGGGWSNDGRTLPPLLDIEYNPYGDTCYGMAGQAMVNWISDFSNTVKNLTGVYPAIYSTTDWWTRCTGNSAAFSANPLFIARYTTAATPGTLPASWSTWALWQWADAGAFPGDQDVMNASWGTLQQLASPIARISNAATRREAGTSAYGTAAEISSETYLTPGIDTVYVSTRANWADALSGAPAAGAESGPMLLVSGTTVPTETAAELTRLQPKRIVVLGGPAAISDGVVSTLGGYASTVVRIAGADRFATAADVSAATYSPGAQVAYIATGTNFPDALAGASIAAQSGAGKGLGSAANSGPVLLTMPDSIPTVIQAELQRLKPQRIVILGGTTVVSSTVAASLQQYATTGSVTRLAGADRFATAAAVSQKYFASSPVVFLATGTDFADALAGAPMVGWNSYPILLVTNDSIPAPTAAEIKRLNPSKIVILGGNSAVSAAVQAAL